MFYNKAFLPVLYILKWLQAFICTYWRNKNKWFTEKKQISIWFSGSLIKITI